MFASRVLTRVVRVKGLVKSLGLSRLSKLSRQESLDERVELFASRVSWRELFASRVSRLSRQETLDERGEQESREAKTLDESLERPRLLTRVSREANKILSRQESLERDS